MRRRRSSKAGRLVAVLAVLALAGCGGGGGGGSDSSSATGNSGVGSRGHFIGMREDLGDIPVNIHGRTITGDRYLTLEPTSDVDHVTFYVDDPQQLGEPSQEEQNPPFDFNGGTASAPRVWESTDLPDGEHEITAVLIYMDGSTEAFTADVTIDNDAPAVVSSKSSVNFTFAETETGTASTTAQLSLSGGGSAPFTLSHTIVSWLSVTQTSGTLPATLTFGVNSNGLAVGNHQVTITAASAGYASAQIQVTVTIEPAGTPPPTGIAFDKQLIRHDYDLDAPGSSTSTVDLEASTGASGPFTLAYTAQSWLTVTPNSGTIPATITVSTQSGGLAPGVYQTDIVANVPGFSPATVTVRVAVSSGSDTVATSVSRHGFTWYFDGEYPVGQFVNGDWYVVGPVVISSTSPTWTGTYDGAMINPVYNEDHGYDARFKHEPSMRVGTTNLLLVPGESLVCVDSWRTGESGAPSSNNTLGIPRPALKSAAVLTCVAIAPPPGSFRPPYGGDDKPMFHVSELRTWLLPQLDAPSSAPSLASVEDLFEGVWLDHGVKWTGRYIHPSDHMEDYGRDFTHDFNVGSLMLMLDFTAAQKETLMIRLVQIGIDMHAIVDSGGRWGADTGGHGGGRKWPVLLAGLLLDDNEMMSVGTTYGVDYAQEDCQTFYLTQSQASSYPGKSIGTPVWGERHCSQPSTDPGATSYRTCCTANAWVGAVLSVHILTGETNIDVKDLWNHDALFDYQDLYMEEQSPGTWQRSWSVFPEDMWDQYREDYGPIYVN